jgi:hypothetical protein
VAATKCATSEIQTKAFVYFMSAPREQPVKAQRDLDGRYAHRESRATSMTSDIYSNGEILVGQLSCHSFADRDCDWGSVRQNPDDPILGKGPFPSDLVGPRWSVRIQVVSFGAFYLGACREEIIRGAHIKQSPVRGKNQNNIINRGKNKCQSQR